MDVASLMNIHGVRVMIVVSPLHSFQYGVDIYALGREYFLVPSGPFNCENMIFKRKEDNPIQGPSSFFPQARPTTATLGDVVLNIGNPELENKESDPEYLGRAKLDRANDCYFFIPYDQIQ